jgi:hypothetical protein
MPASPIQKEARRQEQLGDPEIRSALLRELAAEFDHPSTVLAQELALNRGVGRIDVALLNGRLHGYEIKSERDSLERLPEQVKLFSTTFDRVTIVVHSRHLRRVRRMVPRWWSIARAERSGQDVVIIKVRTGQRNQHVDTVAVAGLLWRDELIDVLHGVGGCPSSIGRLPRAALAGFLAASLSSDAIAEVVRAKLKARTGWQPTCRSSGGKLGSHHGKVVARPEGNPLGQIPWS